VSATKRFEPHVISGRYFEHQHISKLFWICRWTRTHAREQKLSNRRKSSVARWRTSRSRLRSPRCRSAIAGAGVHIDKSPLGPVGKCSSVKKPSLTIEVEPAVSPTEAGAIEITPHQDANTKRKRRENARFDRVARAHEQGGSMQRVSKSQWIISKYLTALITGRLFEAGPPEKTQLCDDKRVQLPLSVPMLVICGRPPQLRSTPRRLLVPAVRSSRRTRSG
jgi:hypothetical protein